MFGLFISNLCYIDPSATSVLISSITAAVVAIGAAAVIYIRKAKKKAADILHIDENANKEVEEELKINDDTDENNND